MVKFSNGRALAMAIAIAPPFKIQIFLTRFQMVGLSDFRYHWKSKPFPIQPLFAYSKSRLVQISSPHFTVVQWPEQTLDKPTIWKLYNKTSSFLVSGIWIHKNYEQAFKIASVNNETIWGLTTLLLKGPVKFLSKFTQNTISGANTCVMLVK